MAAMAEPPTKQARKKFFTVQVEGNLYRMPTKPVLFENVHLAKKNELSM